MNSTGDVVNRNWILMVLNVLNTYPLLVFFQQNYNIYSLCLPNDNRNVYTMWSSLFSSYRSIALDIFSNAICNDGNSCSFPRNGITLGSMFLSMKSNVTYLDKYPSAISNVALTDARLSSWLFFWNIWNILSLNDAADFLCMISQLSIAFILSNTNYECLSPIYPKHSATHCLSVNSGSAVGILRLMV